MAKSSRSSESTFGRCLRKQGVHGQQDSEREHQTLRKQGETTEGSAKVWPKFLIYVFESGCFSCSSSHRPRPLGLLLHLYEPTKVIHLPFLLTFLTSLFFLVLYFFRSRMTLTTSVISRVPFPPRIPHPSSQSLLVRSHFSTRLSMK